MNQRPNTRQTRSQTRAAQQLQQQAGINLQSVYAAGEPAARPAVFEASTVDIEGGDDIDCGSCVRPNNAEMYMVQCGQCQIYYHFSCAGVTIDTVYLKPFVCKTCAQLRPARNTPSVRSASSVSVRSSQISAELRRVEEELQLEDQMSLLLERKKQLMAKRHELLSQKGDAKSRSSGRSSRTATDRVQDWIMDQGMAENSGHGIDKPMTDPTESINQLYGNPVNQLNAGRTSTPLTKELGAVPKDRKQSSEAAFGVSNFPKLPGIPPVDNQSVLGTKKTLLDKPFPKGAIGKLFLPASAYETWRSETKRHLLQASRD